MLNENLFLDTHTHRWRWLGRHTRCLELQLWRHHANKVHLAGVFNIISQGVIAPVSNTFQHLLAPASSSRLESSSQGCEGIAPKLQSGSTTDAKFSPPSGQILKFIPHYEYVSCLGRVWSLVAVLDWTVLYCTVLYCTVLFCRLPAQSVQRGHLQRCHRRLGSLHYQRTVEIFER